MRASSRRAHHCSPRPCSKNPLTTNPRARSASRAIFTEPADNPVALASSSSLTGPEVSRWPWTALTPPGAGPAELSRLAGEPPPQRHRPRAALPDLSVLVEVGERCSVEDLV